MRTQLIEKEDKRIVWLDFVKFIAIFMMIAVHCTDNVTPAERSEPWYNLWAVSTVHLCALPYLCLLWLRVLCFCL